MLEPSHPSVLCEHRCTDCGIRLQSTKARTLKGYGTVYGVHDDNPKCMRCRDAVTV